MPEALNRQVQIFLLFSIGLIALPHVEHIPPLLSAFFNLLLAWRFIAVRKTHWLPNKAALFLLTLTAVALLYVHHQGILGRDAGTSLFVTALGLKLLEIRTIRDVYLSVFLAFIVAATQFLYLQNIFMAAYILAVSCILIATLICVNSPNPQPAAALKTSAGIVLQALPLAVAMFIFFPRVEAPRWMVFQDKHKARMGLNDVLEPGSISELGLSGELAFRVKFQGPIPPPEQRYWRGPVFTHTDGKRWTESKNDAFWRHLDKLQFQGAPYRYTLLMEPQDKKWVFALDMPTDFPDTLHRNAFYQLLTSKDPEMRAEYAIVSYPRYNTGYLTRTEYRDNLQLPAKPSPRIRDLVERLQGFKGDPETFIDNLLQYFKTNRFYYTLMPPLMEENPIETFLFETRRGFCSHYATAFAYLMRVVGAPARVVGGYQGGELNKVGNFLEIRQANAHAWTEVWLDKRGWVRVDPTAAIAPERIRQDVNVDLQIALGEVNFTPVKIDNAAINWLKQAAYLWDSIDYNWQRWVINYNSGNQSKLMAFFNIGNLRTLAYWLVGVLLLVTVPLAWLLLRGKTRQTDKALQIYTRFCRKLAKKGLQRKAQEGAHDFAARAIASLPEKAESIKNITALYNRVRYGKNPDAAELQLLRRQVRSFRA
jgi:transglutaminase-like putative cysteine protease